MIGAGNDVGGEDLGSGDLQRGSRQRGSRQRGSRQRGSRQRGSRQRGSRQRDLGSIAAEQDAFPGRTPANPVDEARIERAVREILAAVGEDPDREGLRETPARVARMYAELFSGLHEDPRVHLQKFFTEKYDEMVLVRDISFNSMCEHHLLPFMGHAHIGYMPERQGGRPEQAGPRRRGRFPPAAGAGANDRDDRQPADRRAGRQGRGRRHRGDAHLHDDSRHPQAGQPVRHVGHEGHLPLEPVEPLGGDEPDLRRPALTAVLHKTARATRVAILTQFIFRLSFGLALGMALTDPRKVTSGYYRNHLYVLLGLNVLAAMVAVTSGDQFALRRRSSQRCSAMLGRCSGSTKSRTRVSPRWRPSAVSLWVALAATPWQRAADSLQTVLLAVDPVTSGLLLGLTMAAMFLGHWYLNTPTMAIGPLERLVVFMGAAVGLRAISEGITTAVYLNAGLPSTARFCSSRCAGCRACWGRSSSW